MKKNNMTLKNDLDSTDTGALVSSHTTLVSPLAMPRGGWSLVTWFPVSVQQGTWWRAMRGFFRPISWTSQCPEARSGCPVGHRVWQCCSGWNDNGPSAHKLVCRAPIRSTDYFNILINWFNLCGFQSLLFLLLFIKQWSNVNILISN